MGVPSLLRKVFMLDLIQGLRITFRYQDPKEIYTEQYPLERPQVAERYRGAPRLNVNPDTDETMCIACDLCALACPEHLIVVSSARNEQTRRKELTNFTYDLSRCMFCGLCEDACPVDALELTQDFELAAYTREGAIWDREMLEKGPQPTQYRKQFSPNLSSCLSHRPRNYGYFRFFPQRRSPWHQGSGGPALAEIRRAFQVRSSRLQALLSGCQRRNVYVGGRTARCG